MEQESQLSVQPKDILARILPILDPLNSPPSKERFIQQEIIPTQDSLRNRYRKGTRTRHTLPSRIIRDKVFGIDRDKPGEYKEFRDALEKSKGQLTPLVAVEIADLYYYLLQPKSRIELHNLAQLWVLINRSDTPPNDMLDLAYSFCIVKYFTRMELDLANHLDKNEKQLIELEVMTLFFKQQRV